MDARLVQVGSGILFVILMDPSHFGLFDFSNHFCYLLCSQRAGGGFIQCVQQFRQLAEFYDRDFAVVRILQFYIWVGKADDAAYRNILTNDFRQ